MIKNLAIVQARTNSKRFPNKILKKIEGIPLILILLKRLSLSKKIGKIIVAITDEKSDNTLASLLIAEKFDVVRGPSENVLKRFLKVLEKFESKNVIRITGDCPLVDSGLVDQMIEYFCKHKFDYLTNANPPTFPDGLDIEIFKNQILFDVEKSTSERYHLEHVTSYIREKNKYKTGNFKNSKNLSNLRWTVDEREDLQLIQKIFKNFSPDIYFNWNMVLNLVKKNSCLQNFNTHIPRNEGANMSFNQKLWKRAKKIIPGGNMLLSKRPELFLPGGWPGYFESSKGVFIKDLDGRKYLDMAYMGVGTNILGYNNKNVDNSVKKTIHKGNMTSLNCPEEVFLAEKLIENHPWADQVKFARTGGEANAIAIRIARAASGRSGVAVCGYHGWHDWYIALNLGSKNGLGNFLLSGLEPNGVPENLKDTIFGFNYNDFSSLEKIVKKNKNIGVIKMEVARNFPPEKNFLQKVRQLATQNKIVLIFDECTSGFRQAFGGLHKVYNVDPDLAVFGKALGNGYAITSIIGKKSVMDYAQSSFISSTFWTERIGPTAGIASLEEMEKLNSWEIISSEGKKVKEKWKKLSERNKLKIEIMGLDAIPFFLFEGKKHNLFKSYLTQEMLYNDVLASNLIFISTEHKNSHFKKYFNLLDEIFYKIRKFDNEQNLEKQLRYPVCHSGFQRLN